MAYQLSDTCELTVSPDLSVTIKNRKSSITFPAYRWKRLTKYFNEIENAVDKLQKKEYVKLFAPLGGAYYLSVTKGFKCVDIRRFRKAKNDQLLPTLDGISFRLCEWCALFSHVLEKMNADYPAMKDVVLCADQLDHHNQMCYFGCSECNPFSFMDFY